MMKKSLYKILSKAGWIYLLTLLFTGFILSGCGAEAKEEKEFEKLMKDVEQSNKESDELIERHEKIQHMKKELDELEEQFDEYMNN